MVQTVLNHNLINLAPQDNRPTAQSADLIAGKSKIVDSITTKVGRKKIKLQGTRRIFRSGLLWNFVEQPW